MTINKEVFIRTQTLMEQHFPELLSRYLLQSSDYVTQLANAVSSDDIDNISYYAHCLKPSSQQIGAEELASLAHEIEKAAKKQDILFIRQYMPVLKEEFNAVKAFIQTHLS